MVLWCGLIYQTLELYLDDIIVYGTTEEEYMNNLHQVLDRLANLKPQEAQVWCGRQRLSMLDIRLTKRACPFLTRNGARFLSFPYLLHKRL